MARRIDIELTSARGDGTWTWRAAGAHRPKGVLDGAVLYAGARVGDVVRAEAEFEIDGITVTSVIPPKSRRSEPERLEVIGSGGNDEVGVNLISAGPRPRGRDGDRPRDGDRGRRRRDGDRRGPREGGRREGGAREGGAREGVARREARGERPVRAPRPRPEPPAPKAKPKRLQPGRAHRDAALAAMPDEQRAIAEQVLRGGIAAVRKAIDVQNEQEAAEGRPQIKADALVALAEELLPGLREADWRDRADAAIADGDEIAIRDLRAVVTAAETAVRDDEGRSLAAQLRELLERRLARQRDEWVAEVTQSLDDSRVVRALRIAGRPPQPGTRVPPDLSARLAAAAGAAMAPDTPQERWIAVLDAVSSSPVRRTVTPAGLPAEPSDDLLQAAKSAAAKVPAVAALLGIEPPATGPARPPRKPRPTAPPGPVRRLTPPGAPAHPTIGDSIPAPAAEPAPAQPASVQPAADSAGEAEPVEARAADQA